MYEIVIAKVKEKEQENCAIMTTVTTCPSVCHILFLSGSWFCQLIHWFGLVLIIMTREAIEGLEHIFTYICFYLSLCMCLDFSSDIFISMKIAFSSFYYIVPIILC